MTVGLDVLVQDVIAAIATEPWRTMAADSPSSIATPPLSVAPVVPPSSVSRPRSSLVSADGAVTGNAARKLAGSPGSSTRSCGPARPGDRRRHARQVQLDELIEDRAVARFAPQPLCLGVALDQRHAVRATDRSGGGR